MCVGPIGETGPLAKTVALRILQHLLAASLEDGSATARSVALERGRRGAVLAMATLDRLRDIVKNTALGVPVVAPEARWRATASAVALTTSAGAEALARRTSAR